MLVVSEWATLVTMPNLVRSAADTAMVRRTGSDRCRASSALDTIPRLRSSGFETESKSSPTGCFLNLVAMLWIAGLQPPVTHVSAIALIASPGEIFHCFASHSTQEFTIPMKSMLSRIHEATATGREVSLNDAGLPPSSTGWARVQTLLCSSGPILR